MQTPHPTSRPGHVWLTRAAFATGAALLAWAWSQDTGLEQRSPVESPGHGLAQVDSSHAELRVLPEAPRGSPVADAGSPTRRDILAEYWGAGWPEIEAGLLARGFDFETRESLPSWAEVEEQAHLALQLPEDHGGMMAANRVAWQEPLSNEWLVQTFGLKRALQDEELAELHELARPYNMDLEGLASDYVTGISQAVEEAWSRQEYRRAPFASPEPEDLHRGKTLLASAALVEGWSVQLELYRADHPELVSLGKEISAVRKERDQRVYDFLVAR